MKQSPLSLEHCHFTNLVIEPEQGYSPDEDFYPDFANANLTSRVAIAQPKDDDESKYALKLALAIQPKSECNFPYSIDIEMEGFFTIIDGSSIKNPKKAVLANGAAMLYGAIRENLLIVTSRFIHGTLMLPTVNFIDLVESADENPE